MENRSAWGWVMAAWIKLEKENLIIKNKETGNCYYIEPLYHKNGSLHFKLQNCHLEKEDPPIYYAHGCYWRYSDISVTDEDFDNEFMTLGEVDAVTSIDKNGSGFRVKNK